MKLCLNDKESVTVVQNHFCGELTKQHAFTITNHGFLRCREFGCPAEQEESPGTDVQQRQQEIVAVCSYIEQTREDGVDPVHILNHVYGTLRQLLA